MGIFQSKKNTTKETILQTTMLLSGTVFTGNLQSECQLRIDATVKGDIECADRIVLGEKALVKGNISARYMEIYGEVEGGLTAQESISLKAGCKVTGDICCMDLFSEQGAFFSGNCNIQEDTMNNEPDPQHNEIVSPV